MMEKRIVLHFSAKKRNKRSICNSRNLAERNVAGRGLNLDSRFAVPDTRAQFVLGGSSFHHNRNAGIDVARL